MSHIFILAYLSVLSGGKSCSLFFYVFFSALPDETAKLIVCVAYKAIRLTDIPRSQLVSSVKAMGIKQAPKEKNSLVTVVAEELVKRNYVNIVGDKNNVSRDDIKMLKPF